MWLGGRGGAAPDSFVHVSVSDGVGVGVVVNDELVSGHGNKAREFGHVPLNIEGSPCTCGANGCWEAYNSNTATLLRYFGRDLSKSGPESLLAGADPEGFTISDLITRARGKNGKAMDAIQTTARYLLGSGKRPRLTRNSRNDSLTAPNLWRL
jgi:N-acetylglucosamine repressor